MNPTDIQTLLHDYNALHGEPKPREYKPEKYELGFVTRGLKPCIDAAHKAVQWWLNDIVHGCKERVRWVTLHGMPGCGKTHLVRSAIRVLRDQGKTAQCWDWARLKEGLTSGECPGLWDQVAHMKYLAIDDIFTGYMASEKASSLQASLLYDLLEARIGKWTLITTNIAPKNMPDERVSSRLVRNGNEVVNMQEAEDFSLLLYLARQQNDR